MRRNFENRRINAVSANLLHYACPRGNALAVRDVAHS
jgi:hypothetical protein